MTPVKKRYTNLAFKFLLVASYLFLFTTQFNYRYFSIANFFVYSGSTLNARTPTDFASPLAKQEQHSLFRETAQKNSHLSLDKRFKSRDNAGIWFGPFLTAPYSRIIEREFHLPVPILVPSSLPLSNFLRGPPLA
jgi:hypothetical protein